MVRNYLLAVFAVVVCASCARFSSSPNEYSVRGITTTPEHMVREASDAHVRARHAETYDWAVRHGMAYPYEGGYSGDMGYFYGGVAPRHIGSRDGYMSGGAQPATREQLEVVRERADDAHKRATDGIRFHKQHRDWHRGRKGR